MTTGVSATGIADYFDRLALLLRATEAEDRDGGRQPLEAAFREVSDRAHRCHAAGNKLLFVGNGGSAGIASHLAIDFSKNGGVRALALNDGAALTCLGNDLGFEQVFAKQIEFHGRRDDILVAISSSGQSANILNAVAKARELGLSVITLSGFQTDNPLRRSGDLNFYIASDAYGFVEVGHLALCHAILDLAIAPPRADD